MERNENALGQMLEEGAPVGFWLHVVCNDNNLNITSDFPFDDGYLKSLADAMMAMNMGVMPDCDETLAFGSVLDRREFLGARYVQRRAFRHALLNVRTDGHEFCIPDIVKLLRTLHTNFTQRQEIYWETFAVSVRSALLKAVVDGRVRQLTPGCIQIDAEALDTMQEEAIERWTDDGQSVLMYLRGNRGRMHKLLQQMKVPLVATTEYPMRTSVRVFFLAHAQRRLPGIERNAAARLLGDELASPPRDVPLPQWQFARHQLEAMTRS